MPETKTLQSPELVSVSLAECKELLDKSEFRACRRGVRVAFPASNTPRSQRSACPSLLSRGKSTSLPKKHIYLFKNQQPFRGPVLAQAT
jgi:hypothetical protein